MAMTGSPSATTTVSHVWTFWPPPCRNTSCGSPSPQTRTLTNWSLSTSISRRSPGKSSDHGTPQRSRHPGDVATASPSRLHQRVVAGAIAGRAGSSVRSDRAVHRARVVGSHCGVVDTESLGGTGREALDDDIGGCHGTAARRSVAVVVQVQYDTLLVAVPHGVARRGRETDHHPVRPAHRPNARATARARAVGFDEHELGVYPLAHGSPRRCPSSKSPSRPEVLTAKGFRPARRAQRGGRSRNRAGVT